MRGSFSHQEMSDSKVNLAISSGSVGSAVSAIPEPMCHDDIERLCLFPIKYPELYKNWQDQLGHFWTPDKIDLSKDRASWLTLSLNEQRCISKVLAFFASADVQVLENLQRRFRTEICIPEAQLCLSAQGCLETVHAVAYGKSIEALIEDPEERKRLFESVKNDPIIARKIDWIAKWAADPEVPLVTCLTAQCLAEGVGFAASFNAMFWLRKNNKCPGVSFLNAEVFPDENMHVQLFAILRKMCVNKMPRAQLEQMTRELVDIEFQFVDEELPADIRGMNRTMVKEYVKTIADAVLIEMGEPIMYGAKNPFEWMNSTIGLNSKTNFFESRVSEYQLAGSETGVKTFVLPTDSTDLDF